ncbi:lytic murein transglycosylase B [Thalassolituus sp. LLYu03]|uniref:lytic murein transglycosylase B n=1 Tax=Thalassolituus sp. LLYu03 TaxID=3421656 RepID=UPI003D2988B8
MRALRKTLMVFGSGILLSSALPAAANYDQHPRVNEFIAEAAAEYKIPADDIRQWLAQAEKLDSVLAAIARPAEKVKEWDEYQDIFLTSKRINAGKAFMKEHAALLREAEEKYGVKKEIIAAIIGVETFYGTRQGNYRVLDSLATLAFDYPDRPLFWRELKAFFALAEAEQINPATIKGSYAGAMGYGQFIPTSFLNFAVDADGDGRRDLWANPADAIFSVANYFSKHGWKNGEAVTQRVHVSGDKYEQIVNDNLKPNWTVSELKALGIEPTEKVSDEKPANLIRLQGKHGAEFWLGEHNFYVITRYNHSRMYAMAVYQLSEALK